MFTVLPLERWKKEKLAEREDFSDEESSDEEDSDHEEIRDSIKTKFEIRETWN